MKRKPILIAISALLVIGAPALAIWANTWTITANLAVGSPTSSTMSDIIYLNGTTGNITADIWPTYTNGFTTIDFTCDLSDVHSSDPACTYEAGNDIRALYVYCEHALPSGAVPYQKTGDCMADNVLCEELPTRVTIIADVSHKSCPLTGEIVVTGVMS